MKIFHRTILILLTVLFSLAIYGTANAAEYYIATSADGGSNSNSGTISQPWATFDYAWTRMDGGDTLIVRGGTYHQSIRDSIPSGSGPAQWGGDKESGYYEWPNATLIQAYPGETPILDDLNSEGFVLQLTGDFHHIIFDGLHFKGTPSAEGVTRVRGKPSAGQYAHHIRFINCEGYTSNGSTFNTSGSSHDIEFINVVAHDTGNDEKRDNCFYIGSPNTLLDGVTAYDCDSKGIALYSQNWDVDNGIIRNSKIYDSAQGINLSDGQTTGHKIYNNVIWGLTAPTITETGIKIDSSGQNGTQIYNNIIYDVDDNGILIETGNDTIIRNNILYKTGNGINDNGSRTIYDHNLCESGCDISGNPSFTNAAAGDFTLQPTSPAIDAGTPISGILGLFKDILGNTRPSGAAWDIGAYEYGGTVEPKPTCTDFTYSPYGACQPDNTQSRSITSKSPSGCTGGNPETFTQSCEYIPGQGPTVTTNKTSYTPDETINVTVDGGNSNTEEWIALYIASNLDSTWSFQKNWQTLNGTQTDPTTPIPYPVPLTFTAPTTLGTYNIRYFGTGNVSNLLAITQDFTITNQLTLQGDLNNDNTVNTLDWSIMNANWGTSNTTADINNDGIVNTIDFSIMNGEWGMNN